MAIQSEDPNERVNHPRHYTQHPSGVETIDVIEHLPCNLANAGKYIWRCGLKTSETPLRDLMSARWYVEREKLRVEAYHLDDDDAEEIPKTDIVWRAFAREVIAQDNGPLGSFLIALMARDFAGMLRVVDEAIGALEGGT
jgi:hypothetical protein